MKSADQLIAGFEQLTEENIRSYRGTLALRYAWEMKDASFGCDLVRSGDRIVGRS